MDHSADNHRLILEQLARRAMLESGLLPDFSPQALAELDRMKAPAASTGPGIRDLSHLVWCSIDNDDSLDLDQLTAAEKMPGSQSRVWVAIADVDDLVKRGSAIDDHAQENTTSVYTAALIFPMLPEKLSTDLTSLNFNEERLAVIIEMVIAESGELVSSDIYRAVVRNQAKLAYHSVAAWLEGTSSIPQPVEAISGLGESLRLQDHIAQAMKSLRHEQGALTLETIEVKPLFERDQIRQLEIEEKDRAKDIIENFMITANGVTARYLASKDYPSIRRVVRQPKRWDRIVEVAAEQGYSLPDEPDPLALEQFLNLQQKKDPLRFPDLSLVVIKLLGAGEYIAELPGETAPGHFGLAVKDYSHSTAPNRRFTDLITQRLLKAALTNQPSPYAPRELETLAKHCTEQEDAANKVERRVSKSAAALLIEHRIGETFNGIVTGASDKGTWVRLLDLPVEGKLMRGFQGQDVGQRIRVRLDSVDIEQGFIDFSRVNGPS